MGGPAFLGPWTFAMAAMMLPSELPLFRLDHATSRSGLRTTVLGSGYVAVWLGIGALVVLADRALDGRLMGMHSRSSIAVALGAAAVYQLTPLKRRCLSACRSPLARVLHSWRDGLPGAFRMGIENGLWCAGCCTGLMAVLLALGMMSVAWMAVVGAAIFVEKATPVGVAASRLAALALGVAAVAWTL
jgi:predicted metal-binding membrane protein